MTLAETFQTAAMRRFLSPLAALLLATPATAGNVNVPGYHFVPAYSGPTSDWDTRPIERIVFAEAYKDDVQLRLESSGSGPLAAYDEVVALRGHNGAFEILRMHVDTDFYEYTPMGLKDENRHASPADPRDLRIHRCVGDIDPTLAGRLMSDWRVVLAQTHPNESDRSVADGDNYDAWVAGSDGKGMEGVVTSPDGGPPSLLVEVAEALSNYCQGGRRDRKTLEFELTDLETELK